MKEMMVVAWFFAVGGVGVLADDAPLQRYESVQQQMGTSFKVVLYTTDEATANRGFATAFGRIHQLDQIMSDYKADSELSRLSRQSPTSEPVAVSHDLWTVLEQAQQLSQRSDGAFDVTVGPLTKLWRRARRRQQPPSADRLEEARAAVGYQHLRLHPHGRRVELLRPGMQLDLGAIGKGYATDQALEALAELGIRRAVVDAGGDLALGAPPPGQAGWKVGLAPLQPKAPPSRFLRLAHCGVATSGDAWQFLEIDGRRYSHILDPRTGWGVTERMGVTIIAPNCTTADALASAVSVLGPRQGLELVEQTQAVAALIVRMEGETVKTYSSKRLENWSVLP